MQFNSLTFILFYLGVLGLHHLPLPWRAKKTNLILASYLFYAAWNPPFVVLLWFSTLLDWNIAKHLARSRDRPRLRRTLVCLSLLGNLGLLAVFKYGDFLVANCEALLRSLGADIQFAEPGLILPIGISFYTFQTLSYTIDVYRGRMEPWKSFTDYALYVTFFPQLVAGPIVRAGQFLSQCLEPHKASARRLGWGLSLLIIGLFQKIVIADGLLAGVVESVYDGSGFPRTIDAWLATGSFAIQIFCDFAGYSTCAIGVAMTLGFSLPDNFRFPYAAIGFSDFWRRWHISLSSWLRDYLYISLGGNRLGESKTYRNLMFTMLLGGLWHGASWTFVAWGGIHGCYLIIERMCAKYLPPMAFFKTTAGRLGLAIFTFALVCITWVFFRADSFARAFEILHCMFALQDTVNQPVAMHTLWRVQIAGIIIAVFAVHWLLRDRTLEDVAAKCPWPIRSLVLAVMILAIVISPGEDRAFIYFQF